MKIIIAEDYIDMSAKAAQVIIEEVAKNPQAILGLATGSTPIGLYKNLIAAYTSGAISFSKVTAVNLDEYIGLDGTHDQSYRYFMNDQLFNHIDIDKSRTYVPSGVGDDLQKNATEYTALLSKYVQDIQLLGLGGNGHIGFNEPATPFNSTTHIVNLKQDTLEANARFFTSVEEVPTKAITMGIQNVMNAKKILLVASGAGKAEAVKAMVQGSVTESCPASILQQHADVTIVVDKEAASLL
ncbi:MAG: glucosamine-6-phosphate deaminase [Bacillota bacterium]